MKRFEECVTVVAAIALHHGEKLLNAKELCSQHRMLSRHLEPVMQALVRAGILRSLRGPRGGYVLAKERRKINLANLYDIAASCEIVEEEKPTPASVPQCIAFDALNIAREAMRNSLMNVTIENLLQKSQADREGDFSSVKNDNFTI